MTDDDSKPQSPGAPSKPEDAGADDRAFVHAAERARHVAEDARRRSGRVVADARDWAVDLSDVLRDTVQTKPFTAVGVSAACAFAAGLLLGMRRARR